MKTMVISTIAALLFIFSQAALAIMPINPDQACNLLKQERFRGNMEYIKQKSGSQGCVSLRKPIRKGEPPASDMRYRVKGTDSQVTSISLHLRMKSHASSIQVLQEFQKTSAYVYEQVLGQSMPEEITNSIISAVRGEWSIQGYRVSLKRLHDRTMTYELIFSIEN